MKLAPRSTGLVLAILAAPAQAADDPGASRARGHAAQVGEVVVTAQKREQNIRDVGMAVEASAGASLEARGVAHVADLVKVSPGFSYTQGLFDMPVYSLRGVGYYEASLAANPAVSLYVDEAPLPFPAMTRGALLDVERVEVLKGPQGTLFGQNATGGAINIVARKPGDVVEAGLTAEYARFGAARLEGFVSGPLSTTLRARLALEGARGGAWQRSQSRGDRLGRTDEVLGRLLVEWRPSDRFKLTTNLNGWRDRSDSQAAQHRSLFPAVPAVPLDPGFAAFPPAPRRARAADWDADKNHARDNTFHQAVARADMRVTNGVTITSITAYGRAVRRQVAETDGTPVEVLSFGAGGHVSSLSQELRVAGDGGGLRHWVAGLALQRDRIADSQVVMLGDSTSSVVDLGGIGLGRFHFSHVHNRSRTRIDSRAVFASGEIELAHGFGLEAGARWSRNRNRFAGCTADGGTGELAAAFTGLQSLARLSGAEPTRPARPGGCITIIDEAFNVGEVRGELDQSNLSWRANLNWRGVEGLLVYVSVSRAYKAGNFPTLSASSAAQLRPVVQEGLTAYEAGFKAALTSGGLQAEGAAFYYDFVNKQLRGRYSDPNFGQLEALVNIPKSHVWGLEGRIAWRPDDRWTLDVGGVYLRTRIDGAFADYSQFGGAPQDFSGNAYPYAPRVQINADLTYRRPLTEALDGFVGASVIYRSKTKGGLENDPRLAIDGYALVDLRAGLEPKSGRWKLTAWARNLGGVYYWSNVLKAQDNVVSFAGRPATYGMTLSLAY